MTLYEQFLETIQSTQDKNLIVDNILKGQKYTTFHFFEFSSSTIDVSPIENITNIPRFSPTAIYLPYVKNINDYFKTYPELYLLSNSSPIENSSCKIHIKESLKNLLQHKHTFNSHQLKLSPSQKQLEYRNNYYLIHEYLKEHFPKSKNSNNYYIINTTYQNFKFEIVEFQKFKDFDFLLCSDDVNLIKEKSALVFLNESTIDMQKTIEKIKLFNDMKNF